MQEFDPDNPIPESFESVEFAFRKAIDWAVLSYLAEYQSEEYHDLCKELDYTQVFLSESINRLERAKMVDWDNSVCEITEFGERFWNALIKEFENDR